MLYRCLKPIVRLAMLIFCRKVVINNRQYLHLKGPLLLACNHPNSFLDSVILDTLFQQPVWSLARGDSFKNKTVTRILTSLKILPVYRTSEGVENLSENYKTFNACIEIFRKNGIVHIFSEGKCINEWHLRPLKKGTARLAIKAWNENIPLQVLPVGINYSSFRRFGKNMFINFGSPISQNDLPGKVADGLQHQAFNQLLRQQMEQLVYEIPTTDKARQQAVLELPPTHFQKIILYIPAVIGWLLHLPLYLVVKKITALKTKMNDHYDSVMTALLVITYPLYVLLFLVILWTTIQSWWFIPLLPILPFTAWAYVQLKGQLDPISTRG